MTAEAIITLLREDAAGGRAYIFFEELAYATGNTPRGGRDSGRRLDAWKMNLWPSDGLHRTAYEIKTKRGDWLRELRDQTKRRPALLVSNYLYVVAPQGVVKPEELPLEMGLMEVLQDAQGTKLHTRVAAPYREGHLPTWSFIASLARRVGDLEPEPPRCASGVCVKDGGLGWTGDGRVAYTLPAKQFEAALAGAAFVLERLPADVPEPHRKLLADAVEDLRALQALARRRVYPVRPPALDALQKDLGIELEVAK